MDNLKISGRHALKIAGEEFDYIYDQLRHRDGEIFALHEQVRILREDKERQSDKFDTELWLEKNTSENKLYKLRVNNLSLILLSVYWFMVAVFFYYF